MSQKKPVFQEVAGSLSTRIRRRELAPGMALPSENELCRQFSISRFSVRKALEKIEEMSDTVKTETLIRVENL